jgi:hypothetical protein
MPADIVSREWLEQALIPGTLSMRVPWPIKTMSDQRIPANTSILEGENFGAAITVTLIEGGAAIPLDVLADGGLRGVTQAPGILLKDSRKEQVSLLGSPALELGAQLQKNGADVALSGVVFATSTHAAMIALLCPTSERLGAAVWARLKADITLVRS